MLVSDLSYSDYSGRQAIGKVINGRARSKDGLMCIGEGDVREALSVSCSRPTWGRNSWRPTARSPVTSLSCPG